MTRPIRWQPGRLTVGWALGVLTTIVLVTLAGGWYEYRLLTHAPVRSSTGVVALRNETGCQVDRERAINVDGFEIVPRQDNPCYVRRPRIRPWQWADGVRDQLSRLTGSVSAAPANGGWRGTYLAGDGATERRHVEALAMRSHSISWPAHGLEMMSPPRSETHDVVDLM